MSLIDKLAWVFTGKKKPKQKMKKLKPRLKPKVKKAKPRVKKLKPRKKKLGKKFVKSRKRLVRAVKIKPKIKPIKKKITKKLVKQRKRINIGTIRIKAVMTTDVKTVSDKDTIESVAEMFSREKIDDAPVMSGRKLVGHINKLDILKLLGKDGIEVKDIKALEHNTSRAIMKKPTTIKDDNTLTQAVKLMNKTNTEILFVLNKRGSLAGIVTKTDVMKGIMELFFDIMQREMGATIETDIDRILNMVTTKTSIGKIAKETGMKESHIEDLAKILEEHGLIKIEYPAIGKPVLRRV